MSRPDPHLDRSPRFSPTKGSSTKLLAWRSTGAKASQYLRFLVENPVRPSRRGWIALRTLLIRAAMSFTKCHSFMRAYKGSPTSWFVWKTETPEECHTNRRREARLGRGQTRACSPAVLLRRRHRCIERRQATSHASVAGILHCAPRQVNQRRSPFLPACRGSLRRLRVRLLAVRGQGLLAGARARFVRPARGQVCRAARELRNAGSSRSAPRRTQRRTAHEYV